MCKIMTLVGFNNKKLVSKIVKMAPKIITKNDDDGFGYCAVTSKGLKIQKSTKLDAKSLKPIIKTSSCVMLHARMATNAKNINNTHPFHRDGVVLIHNGVVSTDHLNLITSTCDSEGILNAYCDLNIQNNIKNFKYLPSILSGWYACTLLHDSSRDKVTYLDVFKNTRADLYEVKIKEDNGTIFCTSMSHIEKIAKRLNLTISYTNKVKAGTIFRYNANTGQLVDYFTAREENEFNISDYTDSERYTSRVYQSWNDHKVEGEEDIVDKTLALAELLAEEAEIDKEDDLLDYDYDYENDCTIDDHNNSCAYDRYDQDEFLRQAELGKKYKK